jgi:hypothetical protein
MVPKARRDAVLAHDAALDRLAVDFYRARSARRRAVLRREVDAVHNSLQKLLGEHVVSAGDLRR